MKTLGDRLKEIFDSSTWFLRSTEPEFRRVNIFPVDVGCNSEGYEECVDGKTVYLKMGVYHINPTIKTDVKVVFEI